MKLTELEFKILTQLSKEKEIPSILLADKLGVKVDSIMSIIRSLEERGLCKIKETEIKIYRLTEEGQKYAEDGLPETRALIFLMKNNGATVEELGIRFGNETKIAIRWLLKKQWAKFVHRNGVKYMVPTGKAWFLPSECLSEKQITFEKELNNEQ